MTESMSGRELLALIIPALKEAAGGGALGLRDDEIELIALDLACDIAAARASAGDAPVAWQPIETAPKMEAVILFAITDEDDQGNVRNWKMATGFYHVGYENDEKHTPWSWDGRQLYKYEIHPTHWQPLPAPPSHARPQRGAESSAPENGSAA